MAIKGKKKSQQRGSQARRRPAQAPRPVTGRTAKKPWYQTTAGQSIAAIAVLVAIVIGLVLFNNARTAAEERELRQQSLENFTDQMNGLVQTVTPPATQLSQATQAPPEDVKQTSAEWSEAFSAAQAQAAQFPPAEGTSTVQQLVSQALNLYRGAATILGQSADAEEAVATELRAVATSQVASADAVWMAAVDLLDEARDAEGLNASGVRVPTEAPPSGEMPDATTTIPAEPEDDSTTGAGGGGGQGGGKSGGKSGGGQGGNDEGDDS